MTTATAASSGSTPSSRLVSMDAYRGFVMVCLAANGFGLAATSKNFPDSSMMQAVGYQFDHVPWVGCAFWDLIQPSFMFLVGVAVPYSFSRREIEGQSSDKLARHVLIRSLVLILLGVFLSSAGKPTTNFAFMNVLTQIGLGYPFLFLFRNRQFAVQLATAAIILGGYWAWFALTPAAVVENPKDIQLPENWKLLKGFEAHWQKNANPAATLDKWLLNLFPAASPAPVPQAQTPAQPNSLEVADDAKPNQVEPPNWITRCGQIVLRLVTRPEPYVFNAGGYQTLNFIPSFVTMLFGLMAGEFIRRASIDRRRTFLTLVISGIFLLCLGWGLNALGYCPLVKRIWTPSWTLFSTGWTLLMLAGFYGMIDGLGWKTWSLPLIVAGMNSMVLYMSGQLLRGWTAELLKRHINTDIFQMFGSKYAPMVEANMVLICFWLFVCWLYRQRIFVRI